MYQPGEVLFVRLFDGAELLLEPGIIDMVSQLLQLVET